MLEFVLVRVEQRALALCEKYMPYREGARSKPVVSIADQRAELLL
jgi:hypothetical protein